MYILRNENSWRTYQSDFIFRRKKKSFFQKFLKFVLIMGIPGFIILGGWHFPDFKPFFNPDPPPTALYEPDKSETPDPENPNIENQEIETAKLKKEGLKSLIQDLVFLNADQNVFSVETAQDKYTIFTSLDTDLQKDLVSALKDLKTLDRGKPQRIAIVAMDVATGSLLAMAGFDLDDPKANPCVESNYPAASIFKIVTATAAVDSLGYTAHTPLYFNGNKYTLYKGQLVEGKNKHSTQISLGNAFAESINPIFGKLGKNHLGGKKLASYAQAFGFNQTPDSELEFESGRFKVTESEFHTAELGSGFNRETMISPIFGAMLVTAVLNSGTSLVPHIVNQVETSQGEIIYTAKKEPYKTAMTPESANTMIQLMEKTITQGTAKKSFKGFSKDKTLSKLVIGGKTGSLHNREGTVKYDWFTGFGKERNGDRTLAVSIVVGHRKYIGTRASSYAKNILKTYFKESAVTTAQANTTQ